MKKSKKAISRESEILSLWRERPLSQRTEYDVMAFNYYISTHFPDLFKNTSGDTYQYLNALLRDHFHDKL